MLDFVDPGAGGRWGNCVVIFLNGPYIEIRPVILSTASIGTFWALHISDRGFLVIAETVSAVILKMVAIFGFGSEVRLIWAVYFFYGC